MPIKFIGRVLFSKSPDWMQRRKTQHLLVAILVGCIFAGAIAAIMLLSDRRH